MEPMENIKLVLTQNIKGRRKHLKINQEELAEKSGLSIGYIKNIERGISWPSPESFEALSRGLGVPIGELLNEPAPEKVIPLPMSEVLRQLGSIPDEIYLLAAKIGNNKNEVWEAVAGFLEDEINYGKKDKASQS